MSAVSPGPEEACPGPVRPPLLCTLLQATHQVDWRSLDQTAYPTNASYLTGRASAHHFLLFNHHWEFCADKLLMQTHSSHDGPIALMPVNHKDVVMLIHSKGFYLAIL